MTRTSIVFLCLLFFGAGKSSGQNGLVSFKQATQALILLKNNQNRIPLQGLDTLKMAYLRFGNTPNDSLYLGLGKYLPIDRLQMPVFQDDTLQKAWIVQQQNRYNLLVLDVLDHSWTGLEPESYQHLDQIRALMDALPCIVYIQGDGFIFHVAPWLEEADQLLIGPQHLPFTSFVAAQIIFGALPAAGILPAPLPGTRFQRGAGLKTKPLSRLAYAPPAYAGMDEKLLSDSIGSIVQQGIEAGAFPGAQVLVAKDGKVVFHEAYGYHTYEKKQTVSTADIYDLASVTKISSALLGLMKLHGEGRFDLDAPLQQYFPRAKGTNKADIPFRPMLAHKARLLSWIPFWRSTLKGNAQYPWKKKWDKEGINQFRFKAKTFETDSSARFPIRITDGLWLHKAYKERRIYKGILKSPLNENPGYVYSDLLFHLLPETLSNLTGQDYQTYLAEQFYHPLGAYTFTYLPLLKFPQELIVPTEVDTFFRMKALHGTVHDEGAAMLGGVSGNAGLFASANDMAKLMSLYLNFGHYGGQQLLDSASVREFTRYQYPEEGNHRGLGFDKPLLPFDSAKSLHAAAASPGSFGHSGYTGTFVWADPDAGLIYIFFSNRVYPTRNNPLISTLGIRPRIHEVLYKAIQE